MSEQILDVFSETQLSETEQAVIAECLSNPAVVKYLHILGNNLGRDYLNLGNLIDIPADELVRRHLYARAQLELLKTLLSITPF